MGSNQSKIARRRRAPKNSGTMVPISKDREPGPANNSNVNYINGQGTIINNNPVINYINSYLPAPPPALVSNVSVSATLPPKPTVFYGRDEFVNDAVRMLVAHGTARLAILGPGGIGKTTVALALLYNSQVLEHYNKGRMFISCEALVDADAVVVSLAKLLGLAASNDLLTAVMTHLADIPRAMLVIDNLESVWLSGGAPVTAVDELLGQLAQIPTLSLVITCRGIDLPQLVEWSNANSATMEPFSLEAALLTFQHRSGRQFVGADEEIAKQLLSAVDRMPLAVSLLGQLIRRGNSVSELLTRWEREHTSLLRTYGAGKFNSVQVSIELSISMLSASDDTGESLKLLSLCSMVPDGLHSEVFEKLRPVFEQISRARDYLSAYALASIGDHQVLKMLSPIRHHVIEHYPAHPNHLTTLCSIYFDIAQHLPVEMDEHFMERAFIATSEIGNLSSLLLRLVDQPSQRIVDSVCNLTWFAYYQHPSITVALAILPNLEPHPRWKACCLKIIGHTRTKMGDFKLAIESLTSAVELFLELGDRPEAAWCRLATAEPHQHLGHYGQAETLINEALVVYVELGDASKEATCRRVLGELMRMKGDYTAAIEHLSAARNTFITLQDKHEVANCSGILGLVYLQQGDLDSAVAELEAELLAFLSLGASLQVAQSLRFLGDVRRQQGYLVKAEEHLVDAEAFFEKTNDRLGLAECSYKFGELRRDQGRWEDAIARFEAANRLYKDLGFEEDAKDCDEWIMELKSMVSSTGDASK